MDFADNACLLLFHVLTDWHRWLELAYRNAGIAGFVLLVLGSVLGSIYAYKLVRFLQSEVKHFRAEVSEVRDLLAGIKVALDEANESTEKHIANLQEKVDRLAERQEARHQELPGLLKLINIKNEDPVVPMANGQSDAAVFPSSVADYLRYVQERKLAAIEAKSDFLHDGNLVPSAAGEFIIISDESSDHHLAVPQVPRFSSSADFSGYFGDYFECDAPSGGEVWITRPALVRNDDIKGGWRVIEKGALEVRP